MKESEALGKVQAALYGLEYAVWEQVTALAYDAALRSLNVSIEQGDPLKVCKSNYARYKTLFDVVGVTVVPDPEPELPSGVETTGVK